MTIPEPTVFASRYEVSCLPLDQPERMYFTVTVEHRGSGRWAVKRDGWCYDANGERDYESIPSEIRDEWLLRFRFDLDAALELAKRIAPQIRVNRFSVADALATAE